MTNLAQLLADQDLRSTLTVPVLVDLTAADRVVAARSAVTMAPDGDRESAEAELAAAEAAAAEHVQDFTFRSVGSELWDQLIRRHPPSRDQVRQFGDGLDFDPETFPLVAVAFCLADPAVPQAELGAYLGSHVDAPALPPTVVELHSQVPPIVWQQLWGACYRVNRDGTGASVAQRLKAVR